MGLTLPVAAQEDAITGEIELGGRTSGWRGVSPDDIADERNPTLQLVAGEEYTLTWENLDGASHNFNIEDEDGTDVVSTDLMSNRGETQTVEFTAEEGMAEYYCGPHPQSMRGEIEFADDAAADEAAGEAAELIGEGPTVGLETVADDLTAPITLKVADEETDRRFIVEQTGYVYVHDEDGLQSEPFLDVTDELIDLNEEFDERGLLGLAFHPDFQENGRFFVRYSAPPREDTPEEYDHTFVLAEFRTEDDDHEVADPDSERIILEIPQPQFNHNSGPIAFGPDGYLYVATGDGGGANDTGTGHVEDWYDENEGGNGQDIEESLLGSILRLDIDVESDERAYGIPDDNPLVDVDGHRDEYYAWGMRNPWGGMSFTGEGEFLMADVGQELFESVNHVQRGGNYGWNVKEGTHCFSTETPTEPPEDCPESTPENVRGGEELLDPVIEYPHDLGILEDDGSEGGDEDAEDGEDTESGGEPVGVSITGGYLYTDGEIDELENTYIFGDWSQDGESPGTLFLARPPEEWLDEVDVGGGPEDTFLEPPAAGDEESESEDETDQTGLWPIEQLQLEGEAAEDGRPTGFVYGFGQGADGELYVLTTSTPTVEGDGAVHRLVPAGEEEDRRGTGVDH